MVSILVVLDLNCRSVALAQESGQTGNRWPQRWAPPLALSRALLPCWAVSGRELPAHRKQESSSGSDKTTEKDKPSLLHRITPLAAPAFLAFIIILLSAPTGLLISVASTIDWLASLANSTSESLNHWFFEMRSIEILRIANGLDEFLDRLASTQIKQPKS